MVDLRTSTKLFSAKVDLDDRRVFGEELLVGKVRSDHEQQVAVHHGMIAGRKSQQTGHSHVKRVVVLDKLLPAHGVHNWSIELAGKLDQLGMSAGTPAPPRIVIFFDPFRIFASSTISSSAGQTVGRGGGK